MFAFFCSKLTHPGVRVEPLYLSQICDNYYVEPFTTSSQKQRNGWQQQPLGAPPAACFLCSIWQKQTTAGAGSWQAPNCPFCSKRFSRPVINNREPCNAGILPADCLPHDLPKCTSREIVLNICQVFWQKRDPYALLTWERERENKDAWFDSEVKYADNQMITLHIITYNNI